MTEVAESILNALHNIVVIIDPDATVEYVSPAVQHILGYQPDELLGEQWWNKTYGSSQDLLAIRSALKHADGLMKTSPMQVASSQQERLVRTADGDFRWILWTHYQGPDDKIIALGYDITSRKEIEAMLQTQSKELEAWTRRMTHSLEYARSLQQAILPDQQVLSDIFADNMIYFEPRETVSGDFYWCYQKGSLVYAAVVDCTGHGVPGAMLSMIGNQLLSNAIIKSEETDPALILKKVDDELQKMLGPKQQSSQAYDGMDVALCVFDYAQKRVEFSGAFRPLVYLRDGELHELPANRFPLGFYPMCKKKYQKHAMSFAEGDIFYLFSDGYADQFGGVETGLQMNMSRKFNRNRFYDLLRTIHQKTMAEQKEKLDETLKFWMGDEEQIDDILVMGVKI